MGYHFDEDYREEAVLADGSVVVLRTGRASDRSLLERGFARLSEESRYLRFMGRKPSLSEGELDLLTDLDGIDRFALAALRRDEEGGAGGAAPGMGVARFVRLEDDPEVAEAAVTVVDAAQGRGLGTLLLRRLAAAARERGVRRFAGDVLVRNEPMRRLLADHAGATVVTEDDEVLRVLVELPSLDALLSPRGAREDLLGRLLAQAAGGGISLRMSDLLLKQR